MVKILVLTFKANDEMAVEKNLISRVYILC